MQDRPDAEELLRTLGDFIEHELRPALEGPLRYRSLVALNLCRILEREMRDGEDHLERQRRRLEILLGTTAPAGRVQEQVLALSRELANRLREGQVSPEFEAQAWQVLMETTREKLAIVKPGHDDYDALEERA